MSRGYRGRAAPIGRPRLPGGTHGRIRGPQRHRRAGTTWPELLALAFGAIYLLIGIIGFFITGFDNFFAPDERWRVDRLHHRNPVTPYAGRELTGVVRRTWLR